MKATRSAASLRAAAVWGLGDTKQLAVEVIHAEGLVVRLALVAEGIVGRVERALQHAAHQQAARDADRTQAVDAVCILHYLRFERAGGDRGAEAVCLDGVRDGHRSASG